MCGRDGNIIDETEPLRIRLSAVLRMRTKGQVVRESSLLKGGQDCTHMAWRTDCHERAVVALPSLAWSARLFRP